MHYVCVATGTNATVHGCLEEVSTREQFILTLFLAQGVPSAQGICWVEHPLRLLIIFTHQSRRQGSFKANKRNKLELRINTLLHWMSVYYLKCAKFAGADTLKYLNDIGQSLFLCC